MGFLAYRASCGWQHWRQRSTAIILCLGINGLSISQEQDEAKNDLVPMLGERMYKPFKLAVLDRLEGNWSCEVWDKEEQVWQSQQDWTVRATGLDTWYIERPFGGKGSYFLDILVWGHYSNLFMYEFGATKTSSKDRLCRRSTCHVREGEARACVWKTVDGENEIIWEFKEEDGKLIWLIDRRFTRPSDFPKKLSAHYRWRLIRISVSPSEKASIQGSRHGEHNPLKDRPGE